VALVMYSQDHSKIILTHFINSQSVQKINKFSLIYISLLFFFIIVNIKSQKEKKLLTTKEQSNIKKSYSIF